MQCSRVTRRRVGIVGLVGLLALAGCMLLQPRVVVDFDANPVSGGTPHRVDFTPIVEGDAATYEWDFGDGTTSTEAAPAHIYRTAGVYTVALTVQFVDGTSGKAVKEDLIDVGLVVGAGPFGGGIYWLDQSGGTIYGGARDGYASETVVSSIYEGQYLAVGGGKIYWTTKTKVRRANLDGSEAETLYHDGTASLKGIAVDADAGKVYWASLPGTFEERGEIWKANLDGSNSRAWASKGEWQLNGYDPWLLAIDAANGRLYWFERFVEYHGIIFPASLTSPMAADGSSVHWTGLSSFDDHLIFGSLPGSKGLALDVGLPTGARYVYWTNPSADRVTRCKPNGTEYAWMLNNIDDPVALAIDAAEGKIYWSGSRGIHRANLDGSGQELIYPGVRADAIALDL